MSQGSDFDERVDQVLRDRFGAPPEMPARVRELMEQVASGAAAAAAATAMPTNPSVEVERSSASADGRAAPGARNRSATGPVGAVGPASPHAPSMQVDNGEATRNAVTGASDSVRGVGGNASMSRRWWSLAAGLAMLIGGGWLTMSVIGRPTPTVGPYADPGPQRTLLAAYDGLVADGFEPAWVCDDDTEFASIVARLHGQPLSMEGPADAGVRMLGVAPLNVWSPRTVGVLMRVDDRPVVVTVDRRNTGLDQAIAAAEARTDVHVHIGRIGDLVLVELSPFASPRALAAFVVPPLDDARAPGLDREPESGREPEPSRPPSREREAAEPPEAASPGAAPGPASGLASGSTSLPQSGSASGFSPGIHSERGAIAAARRAGDAPNVAGRMGPDRGRGSGRVHGLVHVARPRACRSIPS
ncbi:MAG: hypothetical protein AB8G96_11115 [Phycisphaerales bacterium]